jgi:hypothetical protein
MIRTLNYSWAANMWMRSLPFVLIAALASCGRDSWEGFVYPDKNNLTEHRGLGIFSSLEECRAAADNYLTDLGALDRGDYECGKNCDSGSSTGGIKVCEETLR